MEIIQSTPVPGSRLTVITGEIDAENCGELSPHFLECTEPTGAISLDLSGVTFIDSSAISELLRIRSELDAKGCTLQMSSASDQVQRILEMTGLVETFGLKT